MKHLAVRAEVVRKDLMLMLQINVTSHYQVYDPALESSWLNNYYFNLLFIHKDAVFPPVIKTKKKVDLQDNLELNIQVLHEKSQFFSNIVCRCYEFQRQRTFSEYDATFHGNMHCSTYYSTPLGNITFNKSEAQFFQ
jgi:hypothetical protein